ncbi:MAG: hypothetical protein ACFCAD_20885 [Pleurocapsa sp.]
MMAILGQAVAASLIGFQITRTLKQAGKSETKVLFESENISS